MGRANTRRWLARHRADAGVRAAASANWRSRAAVKLIELDESDRLFRAGLAVLDLGAAPGGWSQVVSQRGMRAVAVDLLPFAPMTDVIAVQGDFADHAIQQKLGTLLGGTADLVLCDAAPDLSGIRVRDEAASIDLHDAAIDCVKSLASADATLVMKTFAGAPQQHGVQAVRELFTQVCVRKPPSSRKASREAYVVAKGLVRH